MPKRVQRRRGLEVVGLDGRHLGGVGHEEVHERRVEQLPGLVVGHPLVERAADALGDAAVDLALDDHRVDHGAAVVDDAVAQDLDLGGDRVGLDDRRVHAVGEGRPGSGSRSPCPPGPAPRRRRPAACRGRTCRRTALRPWPPRRRRSAAGWTAPTTVPRSIDVAGAPLTRTTPSTISRSSGEPRGRRPRSAAPWPARCARRGRSALPLITAAREAKVPTAYGIRRVSPVVTSTSSMRTPSSCGDDLREDGLVALALGGQAGRDLDLAGGLDRGRGAPS